MKLRVLTALVLMPLVVYLVGWAPKWLFLLALLGTVELGLYEYFALCRHGGAPSFPVVGHVAGGLVCLSPAFKIGVLPDPLLPTLLLVLLFTMLLALFRAHDLKHYLAATASTLLGVLYVAFTLSFLVPLRFPRFSGPGEVSHAGAGAAVTLFLFAVIWADDIFAYLVGRLIGRTPLFPRVSPKKTVEGAFGGLLGSLLVGWAFAVWIWNVEDLPAIMLIAGLTAVAGQLGDLTESALKRSAAVKDSGAVLPGHGGLLDRIDSLLFAAPLFWLVVNQLGALRVTIGSS